jgi:hypothetical protein
MLISKVLASDDKLFALRKGDPMHEWQSLDDRLCCILCEKTFSGRQVEVSISPTGRVRLHCSSEACTGTPNEWVHPGNPLISGKASRDWERVLNGKKGHHKNGASRPIRYANV